MILLIIEFFVNSTWLQGKGACILKLWEASETNLAKNRSDDENIIEDTLSYGGKLLVLKMMMRTNQTHG